MTNVHTNRRIYKGVVIERAGLDWIVWRDYVTQRWNQPRVKTLIEAHAVVSQAVSP